MGREEHSKELLTVREASRLLNVHTNTLRGWTEQGVLKAHRVGPRRDRRFKRDDVMALLRK